MSVNIPQTANDLDTDSIAFECEELAKQADKLADVALFAADPAVETMLTDLARLIASTNRNMARMMSRG